MKDYAGIIVVGIIAFFLLFNVFGGNDQRGMSGSATEDTYGELPSEPDRSEILNTIEMSEAKDIESLVQESFPLLDTVRSDQGISRIYMTKELTLKEVADSLSSAISPEEISERQENKQALIYPDHFVIIQESDEEAGLITIELASDEFVRNNYSPSFFQGLFLGSLLNRALGSNDWYDRRRSSCQQTGNCYGGYGMYGNYNSGGTSSMRGSTNRGGGPGTGK
ncbi:protein of unknown function [Halobacillus karajensis]|uniref:DUF4247 domain-containing protein n=1 Tax=Halobacillus karajensis TaxID=195088 RepID=A0A024P7P3_9BACI|nr:DUF4247 domain-containing protein [Halobacillus karajensis]CDQ18297.1 hypothetical protein BN982_00557 [Halobacillus karajensis]CDQ24651.1 hypothetical protein BN983_02945 [Halobacillus karajensis]CDQ29103.1 hypothetical protein BN981_03464 [Halobacillus karajensis]SEI06230.1 protein of unknown function [Halobacillus karajensis]